MPQGKLTSKEKFEEGGSESFVPEDKWNGAALGLA